MDSRASRATRAVQMEGIYGVRSFATFSASLSTPAPMPTRSSRVNPHHTAVLSPPPQALSEAEARVVFTRLAAALQYLHDACGMVHRDVKLENVLVEKGGAMDSVRLADFGFTVPTVSAKTKGVVESGLKGTLEYASPEVLVAYLEPGGVRSLATPSPAQPGRGRVAPARACLAPAPFSTCGASNAQCSLCQIRCLSPDRAGRLRRVSATSR